MITDYENGVNMGAFLPGLKKIGRYTSKVTGGLAKAFLPPGIVDLAAKFDPTKKKAFANAKKSAAELLTPPVKKPMVKKSLPFNLTPQTIGIGVAALAALLLIGKRR